MKLILIGALFASLYYFPFYTVGAFVALVVWVNFFRKPSKKDASIEGEQNPANRTPQSNLGFGKTVKDEDPQPMRARQTPAKDTTTNEDWDSVFNGSSIPISVKRADGTTETQFLSSGEKGKEQLAALLGQKI